MQTFKVFDPLTGDESQVGAESAEHAARCWAEWMDAVKITLLRHQRNLIPQPKKKGVKQ